MKVQKKRKGRMKAVPTIVEGIKFDSKLEAYCYSQLREHNIEVQIKNKYTIQPGFTYLDKKIRPITWTPDFYLPYYNKVLETKGLANDGFGNKVKLTQYYFTSIGFTPEIIILKNQEQIREYIKQLTQ